MLKRNVGTIDRAIRVLVGIVLLAAFFLYPDASWRYWTLIGLVSLITGLAGSCPRLLLAWVVDMPDEEGVTAVLDHSRRRFIARPHPAERFMLLQGAGSPACRDAP